MARLVHMAHAGRDLLRWEVRSLGRGVLAILLLVATTTPGQTGGLLDWLFPGKGSQGSEAPRSEPGAALASVRLTVEGMVCYG